MKSVRFEPLDPGVYREIVRRALAEDVGRGDVTTETVIDGDQKARAIVLSKSSCVIAGVDIASEAFRQLDPRVAVEVRCKDGDGCEPCDCPPPEPICAPSDDDDGDDRDDGPPPPIPFPDPAQ